MSLNEIRLSTVYKHKYQLKFNSETWCIAELYWSHLKNYNANKIQKAVVRLSDNYKEKSRQIDISSDVAKIEMDFDFEIYFKKNKQAKKEMQLDVLQRGMLLIAKNQGWSIDPLLDAYNGCILAKLEYKFWLKNKKLKTSPNRENKFGLWCNWDIDSFELFGVLFDKKENEIKKERLIVEEPYNGEFSYYLDWGWKDDETIVLEDNYKYSNKKDVAFKVI